MMKHNLFLCLLAATLVAMVIVPVAASPAAAAPCVPGAAYDPACDANQNGVIDVFDIQLTAGHWNQNGTFTSGSWDLTGNAGTNPATNYVGTTDNQPLVFKANGNTALRLLPGGLSADAPNVLGGSGLNSVTVGVDSATVSGGGTLGAPNRVTDGAGTVGGGMNNRAGNNAGTVSDALNATVAGGASNTAASTGSTVGGGSTNNASGQYSTIGGGLNNTASGTYSAVPGGYSNAAAGTYSFAAGRRAKANNPGAFVLADSNDFDLLPAVNNAFTARFTGGVRFILGIDGTGASTWLCAVYNGGSWGCSSNRNVKENFQPVDGREILAKLMTVPITTWNAIGTDPTVRRMGPMAQDFYAAFGLGDDDKVITTGDLDGVALASIQGLYHMVLEKDARITALEKQIDGQQDQIDALLVRLAALEQAATASAP